LGMVPLKCHDLSVFRGVAFFPVLLSSSLCSLCPAPVKAAARTKLEWLDAVARCVGCARSLLVHVLLGDSHTVGPVPRHAGWFGQAVLLPLLRNITRTRAMILFWQHLLQNISSSTSVRIC